MPLPGGKVAIANMAFDYIGHKSIADFDNPRTDAERLAARWYDHCRRYVFRSFSPACAAMEGTATRVGDGGEFADKYKLPNNFVRLLSVGHGRKDVPRRKYARRGGFICIDNEGASSLPIWYIFDESDPTHWDENTREVIVLTMALKFAYAITKKKSVIEQVNELLKLELGQLITVTGQETRPRRIEQSRISRARRAGASVSETTGSIRFT
jgi:hypothetical protein